MCEFIAIFESSNLLFNMDYCDYMKILNALIANLIGIGLFTFTLNQLIKFFLLNKKEEEQNPESVDDIIETVDEEEIETDKIVLDKDLMNISHISKVYEFNKIFNVPRIQVADNENKTNDSANKDILINGLSLIKEEASEMTEALQNNDIIEVKDAICDLIYVIYGMFWRLGMSEDEVLNEFNENYTYDLHFVALTKIDSILNRRDLAYIHMFDLVNDYDFDIEHNFRDGIELYGLNSSGSLYRLIHTIRYQYNNHINPIYVVHNMLEEINAIIMDDIKDLQESVEEVNLANIKKNLFDLLINVYLFTNPIFDINSNFAIVHQSNMSKLCSSEEEAIATVNNYKAKFENGECSYDSPYHKQINDTLWGVYNKSTNKVLKNINYHPVEHYYGWTEKIYKL